MEIKSRGNAVLTHTPSTIINIFNNALSVKEDKRIIVVEGVYESKGSKSYSGNFYDILKDETGNQSLTIVVPEILREDLKEEYTYKMKGFLNRKVRDDGYIQLNFGVVDILSNEGKRMSSKALKVFDVRKKKADIGYRKIEDVLRRKLYNNEFINIALIYGNEAVIDKDIYEAIGETANCYNIVEHRINLASRENIIEKINELNDTKYDVIVVARGGGTGLDVFNDPDLAESALNLIPIFVTAIGHAVDDTLLQDIADKKFDTPTSLGHYLKEVAYSVINDLNRKKEEKEHYERIESDLKSELANQRVEYEIKLKDQDKNFESKLEKNKKYEIILFVIGIIIGVILPKLLK